MLVMRALVISSQGYESVNLVNSDGDNLRINCVHGGSIRTASITHGAGVHSTFD